MRFLLVFHLSTRFTARLARRRVPLTRLHITRGVARSERGRAPCRDRARWLGLQVIYQARCALGLQDICGVHDKVNLLGLD